MGGGGQGRESTMAQDVLEYEARELPLPTPTLPWGGVAENVYTEQGPNLNPNDSSATSRVQPVLGAGCKRGGGQTTWRIQCWGDKEGRKVGGAP